MGSPSTAAELRADVFIGPFLPFEQGAGTFVADTVPEESAAALREAIARAA